MAMSSQPEAEFGIADAKRILGEVFAPFVGSITHDRTEVEASRVGGDERFGKDDEPRSLAGGLTGERVDFFDRPLAVECHGRRLDDGDRESPQRGRLGSLLDAHRRVKRRRTPR